MQRLFINISTVYKCISKICCSYFTLSLLPFLHQRNRDWMKYEEFRSFFIYFLLLWVLAVFFFDGEFLADNQRDFVAEQFKFFLWYSFLLLMPWFWGFKSRSRFFQNINWSNANQFIFGWFLNAFTMMWFLQTLNVRSCGKEISSYYISIKRLIPKHFLIDNLFFMYNNWLLYKNLEIQQF